MDIKEAEIIEKEILKTYRREIRPLLEKRELRNKSKEYIFEILKKKYKIQFLFYVGNKTYLHIDDKVNLGDKILSKLFRNSGEEPMRRGQDNIPNNEFHINIYSDEKGEHYQEVTQPNERGFETDITVGNGGSDICNAFMGIIKDSADSLSVAELIKTHFDNLDNKK